VFAAIGWGAFAASSLVLGALLALGRRWPDRAVGLVLSFGAGALISAVSFELAEEGVRIGGPLPLALGLAAGALTYFLADRPLERKPGGGGSLALGAFLDGIPEQAVLGIGLAAGEGVSVGLLVAVFVSNLPESIGSSADMLEAQRPRRQIVRLWLVVSIVCALATSSRVRSTASRPARCW
jgi:ZIP family zinc transporter